MLTASTFNIDSNHKRQYREEGYFVLERVIPDDDLELLRSECRRFIELMNKQMDECGADVLGINHRNKRYFINDVYQQDKRIGQFIFSDLLAEICLATLGPDAYLFWNQYVVKGAEVGMKFGWHQDSGYVGHPHRPYLSCWCALDDVHIENGTVYVLPYSRAGTRELVPHVQEAGSNDLIGYHGSDPGEPVIVPAGSIAVFSSTTFHRSGPNTTDSMRRVFLAQYSAEPIMTADGTKLWGAAIPFLKDSKRVI
jgi:ectoine hydroxylase-related dioxygenase (phytanoyl-CoA dioxygenase family)